MTGGSIERGGRGSSPRVRGTLRCVGAARVRPSVHPRVCGEHWRASRRAGRTPVHPRVCGEHERIAARRQSIPTVHPRVCGEHGRRCRDSWPVDAVHPRVCGERVAAHQRDAPTGGSSPRVRGTLRGSSVALDCRFIPACAGNTSPALDAIARSRFIPACAGNTRPISARRLQAAVHPRVCGEHALRGGDAAGAVHPRVCGERVAVWPVNDAACVGSSPRVRGTHGQSVARQRAGSSPRVRGTHTSWDFPPPSCPKVSPQRRLRLYGVLSAPRPSARKG